MAADPARFGVGQRQYGQLDQRGALDQPVEQAKLERVDEILGIVKHDRLGARRAGGLVLAERGMEMIEAVGLGGRPVGGDEHGPHARIGDARDCRGGGGVVAIMTDVEPVVVMLIAREGRAQHLFDHRRLVPRRDEHRQPSGPVGGRERGGERSREAGVDGQRAPPRSREVDQVDEQVVEREQ